MELKEIVSWIAVNLTLQSTRISVMAQWWGQTIASESSQNKGTWYICHTVHILSWTHIQMHGFLVKYHSPKILAVHSKHIYDR